MESPTKSTTSRSGSCAPCRYRRRRCEPYCPLAPFFPLSSYDDFLAVQKLFGVANVTKALKGLDSPAKKAAAAKSIIYQAKARVADPVGGCYARICALKNRIQILQNELQTVLQQLNYQRILASQSVVSGDLEINSGGLAQFSGGLNQEMGNFDAQQVFDGIPARAENQERFDFKSGDCEGFLEGNQKKEVEEEDKDHASQ